MARQEREGPGLLSLSREEVLGSEICSLIEYLEALPWQGSDGSKVCVTWFAAEERKQGLYKF